MKAWERNYFDICQSLLAGQHLFLLIRPHQKPRLISFDVQISLLTSQTLFPTVVPGVVVVFYDDSELIVSIRSISPRLGDMLSVSARLGQS